MKKRLLFTLVSVLMLFKGYSQTDKLWTSVQNRNIITSKNVTRLSFPKEFDLYDLNINPLKQILFSPINNFLIFYTIQIDKNFEYNRKIFFTISFEKIKI